MMSLYLYLNLYIAAKRITDAVKNKKQLDPLFVNNLVEAVDAIKFDEIVVDFEVVAEV